MKAIANNTPWGCKHHARGPISLSDGDSPSDLEAARPNTRNPFAPRALVVDITISRLVHFRPLDDRTNESNDAQK